MEACAITDQSLDAQQKELYAHGDRRVGPVDAAGVHVAVSVPKPTDGGREESRRDNVRVDWDAIICPQSTTSKSPPSRCLRRRSSVRPGGGRTTAVADAATVASPSAVQWRRRSSEYCGLYKKSKPRDDKSSRKSRVTQPI